jgi:hypothetical protein
MQGRIGVSSESVNVIQEMKKRASKPEVAVPVPPPAPPPAKVASRRRGFPKMIVGKPVPIVRDAPKHRQNEPCPCGSGKKFKRCHGR